MQPSAHGRAYILFCVTVKLFPRTPTGHKLFPRRTQTGRDSNGCFSKAAFTTALPAGIIEPYACNVLAL